MYEDITPESLKSEMAESLETDISTVEGSFINNIFSPIAYKVWLAYGEFQKMLDVMFMETSDGEFVDRRCAEEGITRRPGTKATGQITFTGTDAAVIPAGTIVQTDDGLQFVTLESGAIASGSATVNAESTEVGIKYNVGENTITSMAISISGVLSVTNSAFENGSDEETTEELKIRYLTKKRTAPASGNVADYKMWATEVPGVSAARVTPLWDGAGTVKVVLVGQGNTAVGAEIVTAAETNIESKRPIGATVTVISVAPVEISVSVTAKISGDVAINDVKAGFTQKITDYFKTFDGDKIYITKIGALLMEVDGVENYSSLTLNSATSDISISGDEVPALGTVTVTGV